MRLLPATVAAVLILVVAGACARTGTPSATTTPTPPPLVTTPALELDGPIDFHGWRVIAATPNDARPGDSNPTYVFDPTTGGWLTVPGVAVPAPSGHLVAIQQLGNADDPRFGDFNRLGVLDLRTGAVTWTDTRPAFAQRRRPVWSPDGAHILIEEVGDADLAGIQTPQAPPPPGPTPTGPVDQQPIDSRILIVDVTAEDGAAPVLTQRVLPAAETDLCHVSCGWGWRDAETLIASHRVVHTGDAGITESYDGVVFVSATTGETVGRVDLPGGYNSPDDVAPDGRHVLLRAWEYNQNLVIYDVVDGDTVVLGLFGQKARADWTVQDTDDVYWVAPDRFIGVVDNTLVLADLDGRAVESMPLPAAFNTCERIILAPIA